MKIFSSKGMLIIPNPLRKEIKESKNVILIKECYCQNGHNLISNRAKFNDLNGIIIKARDKQNNGLIALSPFYGDKSRISLDIELVDSDIIDLICPECDSNLPIYSSCGCGANLIALFTDAKADYTSCFGICDRVGCYNAEIKKGSELLSFLMIESQRTQKADLRGFNIGSQLENNNADL